MITRIEKRITRLIRSIRPGSWIYLLLHIIIFLIGTILINNKNSTQQAVGMSLVATGIAGWVLYLYVSLTQNVSEKLVLLSSFGFVAAFEARSARIKAEYDKRLDTVCDNIDVLGFGLSNLRQDYQNSFDQWSKKAKVRILLIDPTFPSERHSFASQRDQEEEDPTGKIRGEVEQFVRATAHLINRGDQRFQVRLFRCLPSVNIFRVDDEIFWGPYLIHRASRNSPTLIVERGGLLFSTLLQQFEMIWQSDELSCPVPQNWINKP